MRAQFNSLVQSARIYGRSDTLGLLEVIGDTCPAKYGDAIIEACEALASTD